MSRAPDVRLPGSMGWLRPFLPSLRLQLTPTGHLTVAWMFVAILPANEHQGDTYEKQARASDTNAKLLQGGWRGANFKLLQGGWRGVGSGSSLRHHITEGASPLDGGLRVGGPCSSLVQNEPPAAAGRLLALLCGYALATKCGQVHGSPQGARGWRAR